MIFKLWEISNSQEIKSYLKFGIYPLLYYLLKYELFIKSGL